MKVKFFDNKQVKEIARKAANNSQFKSDYPYDHKSYEDGFYDGMLKAIEAVSILNN